MMKNPILILAILAITFASCSKDDDTSPAPVQGDPTAMRLDSITLVGFNEMNSQGSYWDGGNGSNLPDPFVEVYKNGILVFTSTVASSSAPAGSHSMSTAASGALPISFSEGAQLKIDLSDDDGDPTTNAPDYIGRVVIADALNFFYGGDHAAGFSNVQVTGTTGVTFLLTGTFIY